MYIKKNKLLNKNYFKFLFSLLSKKISIYITISIYLLMILSYTLIVPLLSGKQPIELFLFPVAPSFLMFGMVVVSCFIAIEIFRTPIDDGTELLVVSKPISRREICLVKFLLFYLYIVSISLISMLLATTSFAIKFSNPIDNKNIVIGIFVATFIIGSLFGSIATLFSLYSKKIIAMLMTIGIAFVLNISSMLSSIIYETPTQVLSNSQDVLATANILNINNKKSKIVNGMIKGSSNNNKTVSQIYNEAFNATTYPKTIYTDFSLQLSTLYTLDRTSEDIALSLASQYAMNTPFKLGFEEYKIPTVENANNSNVSHIIFKLPSGIFTSTDNDGSNIIIPNEFILFFSTSTTLHIYSESDYSTNVNAKYKYSTNEFEKQTIVDNDQFQNFVTNNINSSISQYITSIKEDDKLTPSLPYNFDKLTKTEQILNVLLLLGKAINGIASNTLTNQFSLDINNTYDNFSYKKYFVENLKKFNQIIYTSMVTLLNQNQINVTFPEFTKNTSDNSYNIIKFIEDFVNQNNPNLINQLIFLRLLSFDFENIINSLLNLNIDLNTFNSYVTFEVPLKNRNEDIRFVFKPSYKVMPRQIYNSFERIYIEPLFNLTGLIVSWTTISIVFLAVTMALYFRRDFA